jgi:nucleoporin POM152
LKYAVSTSTGHTSEHDVVVNDPNGFIETRSDGVFELISVVDSSCPGLVKKGGNKFEVTWIQRPKVDILGFEAAPPHGVQQKEDICAQEESTLDITLHGKTSARC